MRMAPLIHNNTRSRSGLSIIELMISLSISSMLLVGVGAAYNASANAAEGNDRFFRVTQSGRVLMTQLVAEIRKADTVVVSAAPYDRIIVTRRPDLRLTEEESREYAYDAAAKTVTLKIYYKRADGTTYQSPAYALVRDVQSASFGPTKQVGGVDVRVPVTVVITTGANTVRLSDTSAPRKLTA
jgi:hypothetical protein